MNVLSVACNNNSFHLKIIRNNPIGRSDVTVCLLVWHWLVMSLILIEFETLCSPHTRDGYMIYNLGSVPRAPLHGLLAVSGDAVSYSGWQSLLICYCLLLPLIDSIQPSSYCSQVTTMNTARGARVRLLLSRTTVSAASASLMRLPYRVSTLQ